MKRVFSTLMAIGLLLTLSVINAGAGQQGTAPPVAQPLMREGDFAVKLMGALNLGTAQGEAEAESTLTAAGIAPRSGWMADYPVTPDIVGELENAVGEAAASGRISLRKDEALAAFETAAEESGLPVMADPRPEAAASESRPTTPYNDYTPPEAVNNYYDEEGPPAVTYYPPPPVYDYLYAWVPYPFWYSSFFFPGFFVLNDFDRVFFFHGRSVICSNHFHDRDHHGIFRIDPIARRNGLGFRQGEGGSGHRGFASENGRNSAAGIYRHNLEQARSAGRTDRAGGRGFVGRERPQGVPRESAGLSVNRPPANENRGFSGQGRPAERTDRSFSAPSFHGSPSSGSPFRSEGRSFIAPSGGGSGRSFSVPHGGGMERSFSAPHGGGGGFQMSHSGGFRGR
jgi:hypothetical protein